MLNLRKVGDNSHVPAVWFAAEPEDKRSNIRFVFYQEGIDMAAKKGASKTTAKTTVQTTVKTAEEKKTRARKTSAKTTTAAKTAVKCEMYLQFAGKEYSEKELMKKVKEVWTKELKHKVGELKDVKLYLKPEESAAYYVINKDTTGRIESNWKMERFVQVIPFVTTLRKMVRYQYVRYLVCSKRRND